MKKLILSLAVIIFFAFYAFWSSSRTATLVIVTSTKTELTVTPTVLPTPTAKTDRDPSISTPKTTNNTARYEEDDDNDTSTIATTVKTTTSANTKVVSIPTATKNTTSPSATTQNSAKFKDGTYTGPVTDVYYGNVEVKAIISGGKLTDVQFLQYPMDRQTSLQKSTHAMPILKSEAISAQSANVNGVSGATETSKGFVASLGGALAQAAQ